MLIKGNECMKQIQLIVIWLTKAEMLWKHAGGNRDA